jgi:hypothetical protein
MGFLMPKSSTPAAVTSAQSTVQQTVPAPEQTAASSQQDSNGVATQVGGARKVEDQQLYGTSTPDLRVDRPTVASTLGTSGSGLKLM